jgi:hypothetical protein
MGQTLAPAQTDGVDAVETHELDGALHLVVPGHGGGGPIIHLFSIPPHDVPGGQVGDGETETHLSTDVLNTVPGLQGTVVEHVLVELFQVVFVGQIGIDNDGDIIQELFTKFEPVGQDITVDANLHCLLLKSHDVPVGHIGIELGGDNTQLLLDEEYINPVGQLITELGKTHEFVVPPTHDEEGGQIGSADPEQTPFIYDPP